MPLADRGREQSRLLGQCLAAHYGIGSFCASPLSRARETAEMVDKALSLPVSHRDELREAEFYLLDHLPQCSGPRVALGASDHLRANWSEGYEMSRQRVAKVIEAIIGESTCCPVAAETARIELLRQQAKSIASLVMFTLQDPEPLICADEPMYRNGKFVTAPAHGTCSHLLGCAMGTSVSFKL